MAEDGLDCPFCDAPVDVSSADFEATEKPVREPKKSKRAKTKKQKKAKEKHTLATAKEKPAKPSRRKEDKTSPLDREPQPASSESESVRIPVENRNSGASTEILFNPLKTKKAVLPPPKAPEKSTTPLSRRPPPAATPEPPRESLKNYLKPVPRQIEQDGKSVKLKLKVEGERPAARGPIQPAAQPSPIPAPAPVKPVKDQPETYTFERPIPLPEGKPKTLERDVFRGKPGTPNLRRPRLFDLVSSPQAALGLAFTLTLSIGAALAIMLLTGKGTAKEASQDSSKVRISSLASSSLHSSVDELEGLLKNWEVEKTAELARRFMLTDNMEERLFLVRHADRVRPLMEQWESTNPFQKANLGKILRSKVIEEDDARFIVLALASGDGGHHFVAGESFDDTVLLDWEFCVRYQPMTLEQFQREKPQYPVPFRVKLKEGDYYNYQFTDQLSYQSVRLTYPGTDFLLYGFIDRTAPFADDLISEVLFEEPSYIINLRYPKDPKNDECVEITSVDHRSWFR